MPQNIHGTWYLGFQVKDEVGFSYAADPLPTDASRSRGLPGQYGQATSTSFMLREMRSQLQTFKHGPLEHTLLLCYTLLL